MSCIDLSSTDDQDSSHTPSSKATEANSDTPTETTPECEEISKKYEIFVNQYYSKHILHYLWSTDVENKPTIKTPIWQQRNKKRHVQTDEVEIEILRYQKKDQQNRKSHVTKTAFGKSIGLRLKNLQPQKRSLAKIKIQEILHELEFPPTTQYYPPNHNGQYDNHSSQFGSVLSLYPPTEHVE